MSESVLPMFSSTSFIVSGLRFSLFLCMVLESVLVSFFYKWLTSFPSTACYKRLSLIHCIFLPPLSEISVHRCVDLSLGFLFWSIDLYCCFCASTILS